jgi:hypothetical protein
MHIKSPQAKIVAGLVLIMAIFVIGRSALSLKISADTVTPTADCDHQPNPIYKWFYLNKTSPNPCISNVDQSTNSAGAQQLIITGKNFSKISNHIVFKDLTSTSGSPYKLIVTNFRSKDGTTLTVTLPKTICYFDKKWVCGKEQLATQQYGLYVFADFNKESNMYTVNIGDTTGNDNTPPSDTTGGDNTGDNSDNGDAYSGITTSTNFQVRSGSVTFGDKTCQQKTPSTIRGLFTDNKKCTKVTTADVKFDAPFSTTPTAIILSRDKSIKGDEMAYSYNLTTDGFSIKTDDRFVGTISYIAVSGNIPGVLESGTTPSTTTTTSPTFSSFTSAPDVVLTAKSWLFNNVESDYIGNISKSGFDFHTSDSKGTVTSGSKQVYWIAVDSTKASQITELTPFIQFGKQDRSTANTFTVPFNISDAAAAVVSRSYNYKAADDVMGSVKLNSADFNFDDSLLGGQTNTSGTTPPYFYWAVAKSGDITINPKFSLDNLSPNTGPQETEVTVTTSSPIGFSPTDNVVHFGDKNITGLSSEDGKTLKFNVPDGLCTLVNDAITCDPDTFNVSVTNGNNITSNTLTFKVTSN